MLGNLLKSLWRRAGGDKINRARSSDQGLLQAGLRTALASLLREPMLHPKQVDYEMVANLLAAADSARYLSDHMMSAQNMVSRGALLEFALDQCTVNGLIMEFGVFRGASLKMLARNTSQDVHGFDSFEGLPQEWTYFQKQGRFSLDGRAPKFDELNICIHAGWFDQTLPNFLATHLGPVRFIHVDCDIYTSTRTVLELLAPRIISGTVIVFDEYLNYPGWQEHEFKAFQEFIAAHQRRYRYLGFASSDRGVAVGML